MTACCRNTIYLVLNSVLITRLAVAYNSYKPCASPIHHWYMGLLIFLFVFRLTMMALESPGVGNCTIAILGCLIGPGTLIFLLVWNIIGTMYVVDILRSDNTKECMWTSTIVFTFIILIIIYLFYIIIIVAIVAIIKNKQNLQNKKTQIKNSLKDIYAKVFVKTKNISPGEAKKIQDNLKNLLSKNLNMVKNTEMFPDEKGIMIMFFTPGMLNQSSNQIQMRISNNQRNFGGVNVPIKMSSNLAQPLLQIIGKDTQQKEINKKLSDIQRNTNLHEKDCIICFTKLEEPLNTIVLKCKHSFHQECLFDWLKINPSCPMCRKNFRVDLLEEIIKYLELIITSSHNNPSQNSLNDNLNVHLLEEEKV